MKDAAIACKAIVKTQGARGAEVPDCTVMFKIGMKHKPLGVLYNNTPTTKGGYPLDYKDWDDLAKKGFGAYIDTVLTILYIEERAGL